MMALALLKKLGEAALKPQKVNGLWRKPAISAKNVARLRRESLLAGEQWQFEEEKKPRPYKKPKGHKVDRLKQIRLVEIEENMKNMPQKIAKYRESQKLKDTSYMDKLLLTTKERKIKQNTK